MATDHPLFIYRYMDRSTLQRDSVRFRNRLAAAFTAPDYVRFDMAKAIQARAGIVLQGGYNGYFWNQFWTEGELPEVLTAITVVIDVMRKKGVPGWTTFRDAVRLAMVEENLSLRIDDEGRVHLGVDEAFEVTRLSTLQGLDDPRLRDAKAAFETAHQYMDGHPPNTRAAIRSAFETVEILARQLAPNHKNLHSGLCKGELKALCVPVLSSDAIEQKVLGYQFDSMSEWVSGLHFYRHGQPESAPPTVETAVFVLTTAGGYARLLARVAVKVLPN